MCVITATLAAFLSRMPPLALPVLPTLMADVVNKLEAKNATFPEKWFAKPMRDQPGYDKKVAKPMDLLTMRTKLEAVRGRGVINPQAHRHSRGAAVLTHHLPAGVCASPHPAQVWLLRRAGGGHVAHL